MKNKQWLTPNKMLFESEHKTFSSRCNYIGTGNVYSNVQTSSFIRSSNQLECNGFTNLKGHLQSYDLNNDSFSALSRYEVLKIKELTDLHNGSILYKFFHVSNGKKLVHGFILTDKEYNHLITFLHNQSNKSFSVISECRKYVCNN